MLPAHKPSSGDFFIQLDGLRGIAILSVVIFHAAYFNLSHPFQKALFCLTKAGFMGVPMFFVLSGFLIAYTIFKAGERFDGSAYAWRRISKIYPPFLLSLLVFGFLACLIKQTPNIIPSAIAYISTYAHFTVGWAGLNFAYWTLMIEIHFYITLPIIYFLLRKFTPNADWVTFALFLIVPSVVRHLSYLPESVDYNLWAFHANMFPKALDNFSLGILFAILYNRRASIPSLTMTARILTPLGALILIFTYLLYATLQYRFAIEGKPNILVFELFRYLPAIGTFCLLFCTLLPSHPISRALCWRPLVLTGIISYEWFLFHLPPLQYLHDLLGDSGGNIAVYFAKTILPVFGTYALAALIYFWFSAPILAWVKIRLRSKAANC